jgi:hypothetical protein
MNCLRTLAMAKSEANLHRELVAHVCSPDPHFGEPPSTRRSGLAEQVATATVQSELIHKLR